MRIKFIQKIIDKIRRKNHSPSLKVLSMPFVAPTNTYKKLVCLGGFGHSGSGALLDVLSEFENISTIGSHDINDGSLATNQSDSIEFDILRRYGGIFDLATAFDTRNNNIRDFKLKNFATLTEYYYRRGGIYSDRFMEITRGFIDSLVDFKINTTSGCEANIAFLFRKGFHQDYINIENPYCYTKDKKRYWYFLKDISKEEYFKLASAYVQSILKLVNSKEILVLDQCLTDDNADFDLYKKILGEYKLVCISRDPRDVYVTGAKFDITWLPRDVKTFIKWYKYNNSLYIKAQSPNYKLIKFEDLVLCYEETLDEVITFLNLTKEKHIYKKKYFDPDVSAKNVGLWRSYKNQNVMTEIEKELNEFCYNVKER